jgi:hypothetical protein
MRRALRTPSMETRRERYAEARMDYLDHQLLSGQMTEESYKIETGKIDKWVDQKMEMFR